MKKIFLSLGLMAGLLLAAGCGKEGEEPKPTPPKAVSEYTLTYSAGPNGRIEGAAVQKVKPGDSSRAVRALPASGYRFAGWSDGSTENPRTDTQVTSDLSVSASFETVQYTLTYQAGPNGSIEGAGAQKVSPGGAGSPVKAVPAPGYRFAGWSDGSVDNPRTDENVAANLTVFAGFGPGEHALNYIAGANGTIEGQRQQTVSHGGAGTQVKAVPKDNFHFVRWSDGVTKPVRTDRNVSADVTVTAEFAIDQHALKYSAPDTGSISGDQSQKVDHGGAGSQVKAVPKPGHHFLKWSDGSKANPRTDTNVTADLDVTAEFEANRYSLTYTAGDNGSIEGPSPQTVNHGGTGKEVTAVPRKGYHFVNWSDGGTTAGRIDAGVTRDLSVTAVFAENTYAVGGKVSGLVEGTSAVLQNKGGNDLTLTASGDFQFSKELLDKDAYAVTVLTQPTSPNQVCSVTKGSGTIAGENVADIRVECVLKTYSIGGTVFGLPPGDQITLGNQAGDSLVIKAEGPYSFPRRLNDGSEYQVKVQKQPGKPNWACEVENAGGVLEGGDVSDINVACFVEAVLEPSPGIRKVKLTWNSQDFKGVTFNLCRAREEIPVDGFGDCKGLKGGALNTNVNSPLTVSKLANDVPYWFQLEVMHPGGRRTVSDVAMGIPFGGLNDTGIDWCADDAGNRSSDGTRADKKAACEALAGTHPGQDAFSGRDAAAQARKLEKTGYGSAGFDFTKICQSGDAAGEKNCPPNPSLGSGTKNWGCSRDNVTGLVWEVKTETGLQGQENTYSWFNPSKKTNGGSPGVQNGGSCEGSQCDTQAYIEAVNAKGLCGSSEWRLPTRRELLSIVDNSQVKPSIETSFFPNTPAAYYWTSTPYPDQQDTAWQVYFLYGEAYTAEKSQGNRVRLVHGKTVTFGFDNPQ